jgi:hypothetical protein
VNVLARALSRAFELSFRVCMYQMPPFFGIFVLKLRPSIFFFPRIIASLYICTYVITHTLHTQTHTHKHTIAPIDFHFPGMVTHTLSRTGTYTNRGWEGLLFTV